MGTRGVALVTAAAFLLTQTAGAEVRSTGRHEHHFHPGLHDHQPRDHPRAMHDEPGLFHLHNLHARIDGASELSDAERAWLHETAERTGRIAAEMQEAARILEDLRAEDTGTITAEREAEIDAKVASQLARIEAAQADLQALAGQLEQRIEGAASLADADKEKLKKLLELAKQRKLTPQQAEAAAGELGGSQQVQQVLLHLLILFILIVILGAG